jgi:hypothetical protein
MDADGSGAVNLTADVPDIVSSPTFSPDGRKIAFDRWTSTPDYVSDIFVMNPDGTGKANLTSSRTASEYLPEFSPDGQRIVFTLQGSPSTYDVAVMPSDGASQKNLSQGSPAYHALLPRFPVFSPDGQTIAFLGVPKSSRADVFAMNADGGGPPVNLTGTGDVYGASGMSWTGPLCPGGQVARVADAVRVCADAIDASGRAVGNVTLDGGVSLGDGPVVVDAPLHRIYTTASVPVRVMRPTPVTLGELRVEIDTHPTTDPVSGQTGLAKVTMTGLAAALPTLGGVALNWARDADARLDVFLDPGAGGGFIGSVNPVLKIGGSTRYTALDALAVGLHVDDPLPIQPYGVEVGVKFPRIELPGGWGLNEL